MSTLAFILAAAVVALIVASVVNSIVGVMSGERPDDIPRDALDMFLRVVGGLELGFIARVLDHFTGTPWVRRIIYGAAVFYLFQAACEYWIHH